MPLVPNTPAGYGWCWWGMNCVTHAHTYQFKQQARAAAASNGAATDNGSNGAAADNGSNGKTNANHDDDLSNGNGDAHASDRDHTKHALPPALQAAAPATKTQKGKRVKWKALCSAMLQAKGGTMKVSFP